jgi:hypothetical protein
MKNTILMNTYMNKKKRDEMMNEKHNFDDSVNKKHNFDELIQLGLFDELKKDTFYITLWSIKHI